MKKWFVGLALVALVVALAQAQTVTPLAPALPPMYTVQPAPPQTWAACYPAGTANCPAPDGLVHDFRGQTFYVLYSANPNLDGGACSYTGAQARPTLRYPLGNPSDVNTALGTPNAVFYGGRIVGNISTILDGYVNQSVGGYCNSTGVDMKNILSTHQEIRQMRMDRVWDAIRFNKEPCAGGGVLQPDPLNPVPTTNTGCNNIVRDTWLSNVRDDCVEADLGYAGLSVINSLFDGCFSGISTAPSGTLRDHRLDTILIQDTLMRLEGWLYNMEQLDRTRIQVGYHIAPWKTGGSATTTALRAMMPRLAINNSVFAFEVYYPNGSTYSTDTGSHWANFFRQIDPARCSNNVLLWTPDTPIPALMLAEAPPGCFTILQGADARWYWDFRKAGWIAAHTVVSGVPAGLEGLPGLPRPVERIPAGD